MAVRVLWALMRPTIPDQPLPSDQEPCFSSGLSTQTLLNYAVGISVSDHAFWTHVVVLSPVLPLTLVRWTDLGTGWLLCLV